MKKILGIGNALVDILLNIDDDDILRQNGLDKGGMVMIDADRKKEIHNRIKGMEQSCATGGSTSNTIHGLARLGAPAGYIGKIGRDEMGDFFRREMARFHVTPHLIESDVDTGIATTFISQDAERTFATYLGAAAMMTPDELDPKVFDQYDCIHVEGYLIFNHDLILKVCQIAKEKGLKISMDMASYNIIEANYDFVKMLLTDYVDIIFANEEEAKAFTGKEGQEALEVLAGYCPVAIVKVGKEGSFIKMNGEVTQVGVIPVKAVDTTGAGDIYASGFLYGLMNDYTPEKAGELAAYLAGRVIEHIGAKLPDEVWDEVKAKFFA
ncbi:MAG: adenosine kinase [Bacteroidales bacterium]|nr:adenosine kinase [Bacteroidales bacterium]